MYYYYYSIILLLSFETNLTRRFFLNHAKPYAIYIYLGLL